MLEKIDETITTISNWIQEDISKKTILNPTTVEMTKALAELVKARASLPVDLFR